MTEMSRELSQVTAMSVDVANEYFNFQRAKKAELRHLSKKSEHLESLSKAHLEKLKSERKERMSPSCVKAWTPQLRLLKSR